MPKRSELQHRAMMASRAAGLTAIALVLLIAAEKLSPPAMEIIRTQTLDAAALAGGVVQVLPAAAFTAALWALRGMFAGVAAGKTFTGELPQAMRAAGWALTAGGVAAVLAVPVLLSALGRGPGYLLALDAGAIAVGAVGIAFVALSSLLREAVAIKSELDEFM
jgi:hypothetical protein